MNRPGVIAIGLSLVLTSSGAQTPVSPTGTSGTLAPTASPIVSSEARPIAAAPAPPFAVINGTVGPIRDGEAPCFADRYPCAVYSFSLAREGPIEVTLKWEGHPRALMVQLYWAGEGLAHEDVAPRTGPPRISFQRPRMEAADYRLRVVSMEPGTTIPFTLTLIY